MASETVRLIDVSRLQLTLAKIYGSKQSKDQIHIVPINELVLVDLVVIISTIGFQSVNAIFLYLSSSFRTVT